jgi:hypothetical protein
MMQKHSIVLQLRVRCNEDMSFLIILGAAAIAAIAGTGVVALRDGYRRIPTRQF